MGKGRLLGIHRLTARAVMTASVGDHGDGGGLLLRVRECQESWVFRYTAPTGQRREMGLGACERHDPKAAGGSLAAARSHAAKARAMLAELPPRDPIVERESARRSAIEAARAAREQRKAQRETLARVARSYHEAKIEPRRSRKYAADWIGMLERHVPQALWHGPVAEIGRAELFNFLDDIQHRMADTAQRVRRALAETFDEAIERGLVASNPITALAPKLRRHAVTKTVKPRAALSYGDLPAFVRNLRRREGVAARCAEFVILTAARTGEAIGARWNEFDREARTWTVPAERMKGGEVHTVYLSDRALAILEDLRGLGSEWVFPSTVDLTKPLSNMAMLTLIQGRMGRPDVTVHGFRATFSTWANETAAARPDVIEACLAHREGDRIRAAYNRAAFATERRALLEAWATFAEGAAPVRDLVPLRTAA